MLAVTVLRESGCGRAVVAVHGELDMAEVDRFARLTDPLVSSGDDLVIDLRHVSFLDSTGLGALLRAWRRTALAGGTLTLRHPCDQVRQVLTLTNVDTVVAIEAR